jgi:hypothetical protein
VRAIRLFPEAVAELAEAAEWYSGRRPGLELDFLDQVERILLVIEGSPASFPRLLDLPEDLGIRRALVPRFPYAVVFIDLGTEVRVLAVAHAKRRPGYWLDRIAT